MEDYTEASEITSEQLEAQGDDLFDGWNDDFDTSDAESTEEVTEEEEDGSEDETDSESEDHAEEDEESEETEENTSDAEEEEPSSADQAEKKYTFKHMDDAPIELTAEEMIPYVNKGLDYDRIRSERDAMKANYAKYELCAEFLESIKGDDFETIEDLMDDTNASILIKSEADNGRTLKHDEALKRVKANRESRYKEKAPAEPEKAEPTAEELQAAEVKNFAKVFQQTFKGEALPTWEQLPEEVKKEFEKTGELLAPYLKFRLSQKEAEIKTIKNNQKNKERSTGSRQTKGKGNNAAIYEGWDDD